MCVCGVPRIVRMGVYVFRCRDVCMLVCLHVTYLRICACVRVCVCARVCVCVCAHVSVNFVLRVGARVHMHLCVCVCVCAYVCRVSV